LDRAIIHLNIADFAVAVERTVDARLRNRPVIIAPTGAARAAVYDMSEEAYQAGVRKGMALRSATRLCRDAALLAPHPDRYERAMRELLRRTLPYSPLIEAGDGDGHLFVDVTGTGRLFGPPVDVARRLRIQAKSDLGLTPTWSVASNKLVAKVATRLVKPIGEYVVGAGEEQTFLAPLPVWLVPGIERDDLTRLREFNLRTVSQVTVWRLEQLAIAFGNRACFLYESMRGIDLSPVLPAGKRPPEIKIDHEFDEDTNDPVALKSALYAMVETAGREMRRRRLAARRLGIVLDHSDGVRRARQTVVNPATANDRALFKRAGKALSLAWTRRVRVRHMRLICDRLTFPPAQQALFPEYRKEKEKQDNLVGVIDGIRERFGPDAVRVGRTLVV
jgi:DNA polymerase-4